MAAKARTEKGHRKLDLNPVDDEDLIGGAEEDLIGGDDDLIGSDDAPLAPDFMDSRHVLGGVSMTWLATVFRMDKNVLRKKIARAKVLRYERANSPLFELKEVLPYLVPPNTEDLTNYIKTMSKDDLPVYMQDEFWSAQLKKQKWDENARELWRTDDVVEVMAEVFKTIKDTLLLWVSTVELETGLTDAQRKTLVSLVDGLQKELQTQMVELSKKSRRPNLMKLEEASRGA